MHEPAVALLKAAPVDLKIVAEFPPFKSSMAQLEEFLDLLWTRGKTTSIAMTAEGMDLTIYLSRVRDTASAEFWEQQN